MITQRRLEHLLALVTHGHFGRAAAALNISQPALTKSIQALESELGVPLLDRKRGAIALTAFGELVVERSASLINLEADLRREIKLLAGHEIGSVKLAFGPYPSQISGFAAIARMLTRYPKLRVEVHVTGWRDVAHKVSMRDVDLGIAELSEAQLFEEFATESLEPHQGRLFCRSGHPILARSHVSPNDLLEFPWVACRFPLRIAFDVTPTPGIAGTIDRLNGDFLPAIDLDVPMHLAEFLEGSDVLAIATLTMMEPHLRAGTAAVVPATLPNLMTNYGFIYLKNRTLSPAALTLMREVRALEAEVTQREATLAAEFIGPHTSATSAKT